MNVSSITAFKIITLKFFDNLICKPARSFSLNNFAATIIKFCLLTNNSLLLLKKPPRKGSTPYGSMIGVMINSKGVLFLSIKIKFKIKRVYLNLSYRKLGKIFFQECLWWIFHYLSIYLPLAVRVLELVTDCTLSVEVATFTRTTNGECESFFTNGTHFYFVPNMFHFHQYFFSFF